MLSTWRDANDNTMTTTTMCDIWGRKYTCTFRNGRNLVARHDRAAGIFFLVQVYKTHCHDGLEAASKEAEGVTYGTDSYVRIRDERCALKTARLSVFATRSLL